MGPNMFYQIIENDGIINVTESTERPAAISLTLPDSSSAALVPAPTSVSSVANPITNDELEKKINELDDEKEEQQIENGIQALHEEEKKIENEIQALGPTQGGKQTKKHTKKLKLRTRRAGKPKGLLRVSRKKK
jgi:hypothetical protein